jgi:hypothetical protein
MSNAPPRPWLFAFASLPYGIFNGVIALSLPYVLRQHGVPVQRIASIGALVRLRRSGTFSGRPWWTSAFGGVRGS